MGKNNNDFELEGFNYGSGDDDFPNPSNNGVSEEDISHSSPMQQSIEEKSKRNQMASRNVSVHGNQMQSQVVNVSSGKDKSRIRSQQKVNPSRKQTTEVRKSTNKRRPPEITQVPEENMPALETSGKKRKSKKNLILLLLLILVAIVCILFVKSKKQVPVEDNYKSSGKFAYDNLLSALNSYDAKKIDSVVGKSDGDSYLAQEWSYANSNKVRESFITSVCANVKFNYPKVSQLSTSGKEMTDKDGNPVMVESSMNNGEEVKVTYVDYVSLAETMKEDKISIVKLFDESGIDKSDYDYEDEMTDLMLDYILSKSNLPTKETDIKLGVSTGNSPIVTDDTELDKLLFSSDDFHNMCDTFAQVATGFTGYKTEKYTEKEKQVNPEYEQWKIRFDEYYSADNGKFVKGVSKWEPWYLRDDNNNYVLDENGEKVVNYYTVKDDQGNDWVEPPKEITVDVEKKRKVEADWEKDSVIPYCFLGAYYCQNEYKGKFSPDVKVGDGSVEHPAGIGTPIITKCQDVDGKYHDIKITMIGYWTGEDAINYSISFSEKNRGFDVNSVIQLICYELKVENLGKDDFKFKSDMFLSDKNSNKSTRTGTMYGFYDTATVKAGDSVIINDWATSTELEQKYACWGSSFNREYDTVYFKVLAGDGDTPSYSAYKAFTGESEVTEEDDDSLGDEESSNTSDVEVQNIDNE